MVMISFLPELLISLRRGKQCGLFLVVTNSMNGDRVNYPDECAKSLTTLKALQRLAKDP